MSSNDYTPTTTGALKLKGSSTASKISKHKKKRPKPALTTSSEDGAEKGIQTKPQNEKLEEKEEQEEEELQEKEKEDETRRKVEEEMVKGAGKTDAEIRHEERRRRKVEEEMVKGAGKTDAEIRHEERRRRKVMTSSCSSFPASIPSPSNNPKLNPPR